MHKGPGGTGLGQGVAHLFHGRQKGGFSFREESCPISGTFPEDGGVGERGDDLGVGLLGQEGLSG